MEEKRPEVATLESLQKAITRLDSQFSLLLIQLRKTDIKVNKIDAEQRRIGVLFEDNEGKFKLTLDGYMAVNKRIESIEDRINQFEARTMEGFEIISKKLDKMVYRQEFMDLEKRVLELKR